MSDEIYSLGCIFNVEWYESRLGRKESCWDMKDTLQAWTLWWSQLQIIDLTMAHILKKSLILKAISTKSSRSFLPPHIEYTAGGDCRELVHRHHLRSVLTETISRWRCKAGCDSPAKNAQLLPTDGYGNVHDAIKFLCGSLVDYNPDYQEIDVQSNLKGIACVPETMSEAEARRMQRIILHHLCGMLSGDAEETPNSVYRPANIAVGRVDLDRKLADVRLKRHRLYTITTPPPECLFDICATSDSFSKLGEFARHLHCVGRSLDGYWECFYLNYWHIWREEPVANSSNKN